MIKRNIVWCLASVLLFSACDMLDIKPVGKVIPTTLTEYRALISRAYKTIPSESGKADFRSDEMYVRDNDYDQSSYGKIERWDDFTSAEGTSAFEWANYYTVIFNANYVIEKQKEITEGSTNDVNQLVGECYLLRAYMHFGLVNLYGQAYTVPNALDSKAVPLKLNSDINEVLKRNTVRQVYTSVLADIDEAEKLINKDGWELSFSYRFTKASVLALRSRVYLYMGEWEKAYQAAEAVLVKKNVLEDFNKAGFKLPNNYQSVENITALELPMSSNHNGAACASKVLLDMYQDGDLRRDTYFKAADSKGQRLSKKGGIIDFRCSFRVGEFYLNSAEAAAQCGKLPEAKARLTELMQKRYTPAALATRIAAISSMEKEALVQEIANERARELAFEGHRWFDLRRTTRPYIKKVLKKGTFELKQNDPRYTILIPAEALEANPELKN